MFDDKYLPATITLKRWISNMQFSEMTLEQTSCIFEQLHKEKTKRDTLRSLTSAYDPIMNWLCHPTLKEGL